MAEDILGDKLPLIPQNVPSHLFRELTELSELKLTQSVDCVKV